VDELLRVDLAAVGYRHVVADEAEAGRLHAHLLHLGARGETCLQADRAAAARFLAATDLVLDVVGVVPAHGREVVGDLGDVVHAELGALDVFGELLDGLAIECHAGPPRFR